MKKYTEKVPAKLKTIPEDFIVEELAWEWNPTISNPPVFNELPNLSSIENQEPKDFLLCEFEKKDIENFKAKKELASFLRKGVDSLGFAGIKDKKAHTVQRISIFKPDLELVKHFKHPHVYLKNFKWFKRKIKIGYLEGNKFTVTLRDVDNKDAIKITNKIRKTTSFANYFGKQRFGSLRENNAKIGYLIVKKKYNEAINAVLTDINDKEKKEVTEARQKLIEEKDYKAALDYFPKFLKLERSILLHLTHNQGDYLGAIKRGERKSFLLYVHAFQSKMFNEILTEALADDVDFTQKGQQRIPLFGYKSRIDDAKLGEIEQAILDHNNITIEDFKIPEIPYLSLKGDYRSALINVKDIDTTIEEDEINTGAKKIILEFSLPAGVYATTFLENFFDLIEVRD